MSQTSPSTDQARRIAQQCFARGSEVFKKGDFDYAISLFKEACKYAPDQLTYRQHLRISAKKKFDNNKRGSRLAAVTTMKSRAALKAAKVKKDYHWALECCEDVLAENPWDSGILLEMAGIFEELGHRDSAVWSAESALERDPADPTVNRALALLYEKKGDFNKAVACWDRVRKAKPGDEEAAKKMKDLDASATIDRGGYQGAESFTRAIADRAKTQELLDESKGGAAETRHGHQVEELQQKIRRAPSDLPPYLQLSQLWRRQGKLNEAQALMEKAKEATGGHPDAVQELAEIEMERLKADLAIARKESAAKPGDGSSQKRVQELAQALNDLELREYQRRSERMPSDLNLKAEIGIRLAKARQYDQAISELQKARGAPGRKSDVLNWIGRSFHAKKNLRMAKRHYEEALDSLSASDQESFKELHYLLGRVCEDMGDKPAATQHYEEVAAVDYGFRDVAKRLDALGSADPAATGESSDPPVGE